MSKLKSKGMQGFLDQMFLPPEEIEGPKLAPPTEHDKLVEIARKYMASRSHIVVTELCGNCEEPDVIAYDATLKSVVLKDKWGQQRGNILLEIKASRSDFLSDKNKLFRRYPWQGIGEYRYFFTHKGLLKPEEIPEGWGLIETTGKRGKIIKASKHWKERNVRVEMNILESVIRRIGQTEPEGVSIRCYQNIEGNKRKATVTFGGGE